MSELDVPIPEVPTIADATIVRHPTSGADCLLVTTEEGEQVAFAFEVESDSPGLTIVDPEIWFRTDEDPAPEQSPQAFEAAEEARADDWLQAIVSHPVGNEWLAGIKDAHPEAYHDWFAQTEYDEGGEEGSG